MAKRHPCSDKMGQLIASPRSARWTGLAGQHAWGSINVDDGDGDPAHPAHRDGVRPATLVDRMGALRTGYARTGSGRRSLQDSPPASHAQHLPYRTGQLQPSTTCTAVEHGIYAKRMGGGSVQPVPAGSGFSVREACLIRGGRITRPLKSATLIGTGPRVLSEISHGGARSASPPACAARSRIHSPPRSASRLSRLTISRLVGGNA